MHTDAINYLKTYPIAIFEKGDYIYHCGDRVDYLYFLENGSVIRMITTSSGEEIFFAEKVADDTVNAVLGSLVSYSAVEYAENDFIATSRCIAHRLTVAEFHSFARHFPEVLEELLHQAMQDYGSLSMNFMGKQKGMAAPRVAEYILMSATPDEDGIPLLDKSYTSAQIARFLGMHRITVNKIVLALIGTGAILRTNRGLEIVDVNLLQAYADGHHTLKYKK